MRAKLIVASVGVVAMLFAATCAQAGGDPAAKCKYAKAKAAGKKAAALLKAMGKNISKNPDPKLAANISKAQSKFTKAFTKAESKSGCEQTGDSSDVEAMTNDFVWNVILDLETTTSSTTTTTSSTTTTTSVGPSCDCCAGGFTKLKYTTSNGSGIGGSLQNFRCSNALTLACVDDADCNLGNCFTMFGSCTGNSSVSCTSDADCTGTCGEQIGVGLPLDLDRSSLYFGSGKNSVPLPIHVASGAELFLKVAGCAGDTITLGPTTPAEAGTTVGCTMGRRCSSAGTSCNLDSDCPATETCVTNCIYGPPLPVPNRSPGSEPFSTCWILEVSGDATGSATCSTGAQSVLLPLRWRVNLGGDMLSSSQGPVDVPGVQACPICVRQCVGGSNDRAPCLDGSECDLGTCSATTSCLGGLSDGAACTPGYALDVYNCCSGGWRDGLRCPPDGSADCAVGGGTCMSGCKSYPTSNDCSLDPFLDITTRPGGVAAKYALTTGTVVRDATDYSNAPRTFSGFCRDTQSWGSLCFEGDPDTNCPAPGDGNAVPCTADSDCSSPYESCAQRTPGAFSRAAATKITVNGSAAGECLADGLAHPSDLVSVYDVPPSFNAFVDAWAFGLPGPGAILLTGDAQLQP